MRKKLSFKEFSAEYNDARMQNGKVPAGYIHRAILYISFLVIISESDYQRSNRR